ncbi:CdaR family protein [Clostridium sp.]|uniref:CdaR family protein n=1 Tax=Clostridium sp. TaxID=1506 RepID=UPI0039F4FABD
MAQKSREQLIVKICCVIAAFILWLYTSNDGNTAKTYKISNIPVKIVNEDYLKQTGLILSPNQKFSISLNVTGKPVDIYAIKPEQFKLVADLSGYVMKKGENRVPVNIVRRPSGNINIVNDGAMWIFVDVDNYKEKTFEVEAEVKGSSKTGFYSEKPVIKPKTVTVSGAESYVNSVHRVIAELDLNEADKNINLAVPLKAVDRLGKEVKEVTLSPSASDVFISVQKTKNVGVNIKTTGDLPKGFILKTIKLSKENFTLVGDAKSINAVSKLETEPIDLSKFKNDVSNITVKLIVPANVKITDGSTTVDAQIILDKVSEKNVTSNIQVKNLQSGFSAKLDKETLSLVISGGKTYIDSLKEDSIKCYINLENLDEGEYTVPIKLELPQNITVISQSAKFVNVNIVKNDNKTTEGEKDKNSGGTSEENTNSANANN